MRDLRQWAVPRLTGTPPKSADVIDIVVTQPAPRVCVVAIAGELDMVSSPVLDAAVAQQLAPLPVMLILELSGVRFLGSAGLASLMAVREGAMAVGASLRLVCAGPAVLRPMDLTGLTELFEVYPDQASALRGRLGAS